MSAMCSGLKGISAPKTRYTSSDGSTVAGFESNIPMYPLLRTSDTITHILSTWTKGLPSSSKNSIWKSSFAASPFLRLCLSASSGIQNVSGAFAWDSSALPNSQ